MKEIWNRHFKCVMNADMEGGSAVLSIDIRTGWPCIQREIGRSEVEKGLEKLRVERSSGIDGVTGEMLRYGRDAAELLDG